MALTPEQEAELQELEMRDLEERDAEEMAMKSPAPRKEDQVSGLEAFGRGVAGALSPISKYGEALGIKGRTIYEDINRGKPSFGVPFDIAMETAEEQEAASKEQQPGAYYGGMGAGILGGVGASLPAKIPGAFGVLGIGAGTGGLQTAGSYPFQQGLEEPGEVLKATGAGALFGAGVSAIPLAIGARGPIVEGLKAAKKGAEGKGAIGGTVGAISEAIPAMRGAARETKAFKEAVQQVAPEAAAPTTVGQYLKQGTQVAPEEEAQFLLNLLQPGKTPTKEFYTQKTTQLYPGQIGPKQLGKVLDIPLEQRVQAREFERADIGRQLLPQAEKAKAVLQSKGKAFERLQNQAIQEYDGQGLPEVFMSLDRAKRADFTGISPKARKTVDQVLEILEEGKSLDQGRLQPGDIMKVGNQEAYKRLQTARQWTDDVIRSSIDDPSVTRLLKPVRSSLDTALKSSPSKALADEIYARGSRVQEVGIEPLEMALGKGKNAPRELSSAQIKGAFGDTLKGEQAERGIEMARSYAKDFAEQLGPKNAKRVSKFFDALANAKTVADRKRVLDDLKFAEGPSGAGIRAGIEKLQQTIKPAPGGASMFRAAPEYLQSVDAFMSDRARQYFNKPFDKLTGDQQYKLVNAYQWFKQNPNATMQEMNDAFTRILKGKGK
jgi:hypothetical protein